jgi:hypothetical protein
MMKCFLSRLFKSKRLRRGLFGLLFLFVATAIAATLILRPYFEEPERLNVLTADSQSRLEAIDTTEPNVRAFTVAVGPAELVVMDFSTPLSLDPVPPGWRHRRFLTRAPMDRSFAEKMAGRQSGSPLTIAPQCYSGMSMWSLGYIQCWHGNG